MVEKREQHQLLARMIVHLRVLHVVLMKRKDNLDKNRESDECRTSILLQPFETVPQTGPPPPLVHAGPLSVALRIIGFSGSGIAGSRLRELASAQAVKCPAKQKRTIGSFLVSFRWAQQGSFQLFAMPTVIQKTSPVCCRLSRHGRRGGCRRRSG